MRENTNKQVHSFIITPRLHGSSVHVFPLVSLQNVGRRGDTTNTPPHGVCWNSERVTLTKVNAGIYWDTSMSERNRMDEHRLPTGSNLLTSLRRTVHSTNRITCHFSVWNIT